MSNGRSKKPTKNRRQAQRLAARRRQHIEADRELLSIPKKDWNAARATERIAKAALREGIPAVAERIGCSIRTLYRRLARYRLNPTLLTFLPRKRGSVPGSQRLSAAREAVIAKAVDQWLASREPLPVSRAVEAANKLAREAGLKTLSRSTVVARLTTRANVREHGVGKKDRRDPEAIPQSRRALGIVQADHTPMDIIVVDEANRKPIGRPWITIVFDIATRAVLGFHATLEAPSATSVAMALSAACLPKDDWLQVQGMDSGFEWPMHGLPDILHLDNGSEFHSEALRRGCERYGIRLAYRPKGKTYTGGHIERYLGTLMRRIHGIPGTTMSNVKERGSYPSEERSILTMKELEAWLTLEIAGRYHNAIHRGIHSTPLAAWKRATQKRSRPCPQHPEEFALDFLPVISRTISQSGFHLFHIRYWDPLLAGLFPVSQRLFVRYDPRNLAKVWVPIPGRGSYLPVPYADLRRPPISQSEQQAAIRVIKAAGRRTANEDAVFEAIDLQRKIIDRAKHSTRARRQQEKRPRDGKGSVATKVPEAEPVDFTKPANPYPGEVWLG
jgi:putative transposase